MKCLRKIAACALSLLFGGLDAAEFGKTEMSFKQGEVTLAATLLVPLDGGPHPGLVLVGGSGPSPRSQLMEVARGFVHHGIAVIAYDKRGVGESGGNWISSSLEDLAGDAVAAYRVLESDSRVDSTRIGLWGISQGAWIAPMAANMVDPAFVIAVTGGGLSPREVETHGYLDKARRAVGDADADTQVIGLLKVYFDYLEGEATLSTLGGALDQSGAQPWFESLGIENVIPGESNRTNWAWVAKYRPEDDIARLTAPVLVLLGGGDPLIPIAKTEQAWREALVGSEPENRILVIPGAGHGLRQGPHGGPLIPEYYPLQIEWLRNVGVLPQDRTRN